MDILRKTAFVVVVALAAACGKGGSSGPGAPDTGGRVPVASAPTDLSSVIQAVHFAYRSGAGGFAGSHDTYGIAVDGSGAVSFTPTAPAPDGSGASRTGTALRLETVAVSRGDERLDAAASAPAVARDGTLWTARGAVLEHLQNGPEGVEQSWDFPWRPGGSGDLAVRVRVGGLAPAGATATGLHFADAGSGLGVRYGKATWVDRLGVATEVTAELDGSDVVLTVPAAVVDGSVFPAVLDPLILSELEIDRPVATTWTPAAPAVASATGTNTATLFVWADPARGGVFAARVDGSGTVLDPDGIVIASDATAATPAVAYGSGGPHFLVVWSSSSGLMMRRLQATPTALTWVDAGPLFLVGSVGGDGYPTTAYDAQSNEFLVAWQRGTTVVGEVYPQPATGGGVRTYASGLTAGAAYPRAGAGITGRLLLAWITPTGVNAQRIVGSTGQTQNGVLAITTAGATAIDVACNAPASEWVVVAADAGGHVVGRRVPYNSQPSGNVATLTNAAGAQVAPAIAWSNAGYYLLAWIQSGTTPAVSWQVVQSNGTNVTGLTPAGIVLSGAVPGSQSLALSQRADPFLAWASSTQVLEAHLNVSSAGAGSVLLGATPVSTQPTRAQSVPAVAASASGYLVVWQDARTTASDIYGAFLGRSGALVGSAFPVAATSASAATPAVASDGTSYLVAWSDGAIKGSLVDAAGTVAAPATFSGAASQTAPRVAYAGGQYLVVWQDGAGAGAPNVLGARVSAAGALVGSASISAGTAMEVAPDVAPSPSGDGFQVVWQDARNGASDVYGARVSSTGAVGAATAISTAADVQAMPSIACGGATCVVAWADGRNGVDYDLYAARLDAAGAALDPAGLAVAGGIRQQMRPSVAYDGRDFLVAYEDWSSGAAQLWGNRVSASGGVLDGAGVALGATGNVAGGVPRLASADPGRALLVFTKDSTSIPGTNSVWARLLAYRNGVSLAKAGSGTGRVTSSPAGIDCTGSCTGIDASFDAGVPVGLTAAPDANMRFAGWGGDCASFGTAATCTLTTDVARSVTATFDRVQVALTVTKSGTGTGVVNASAGGLSCGSACSASYDQGSTVDLTASPSAGSTFVRWSGACAGTGACSVTMDAGKAVGAQFDISTHRVVAQSLGEGSVTFSTLGSAGSCGTSCMTYVAGSVATLTAVPSPGYRFASWSGDCAGTGACELTMDADKAVAATFVVIPPVTHTLAVTKTGSGTVATGDGRISCGLACSAASASYVEGTSVTLTASPDPGWSFDGWGSPCSGTGDCTLVVGGDLSVSASFSPIPPPPQTLAVTLAGSGVGSVDTTPAGTSCGPGCTTFPSGTLVILSATPAAPPAGGGTYVFGGWSGACTGTGRCEVTLDGPRNVTATFDYVSPTYRSLTVTNAGGGTVTDGGQISCGGSCSGTYVDGTVVTLSATPAPGAAFAGWGGACSGTGDCQVTLTASRTVTATFTYRVAVAGAGTGTGTVTSSPAGITCGSTCDARFPYGSTVSLSAAPSGASVFTGWSGAGCSGAGACDVQVLGAVAVTATFDIPPPQRYDLTVVRQGLGAGTVTSDLGGISCGAACLATYDAGTVVNLTAGAVAGSVFGGWGGGGCSGTATACQVTVDASKAVTARFDVAPLSTYSLAVRRTGSGTGTVTSAPAGIDCGTACSAPFSAGSSVTLTAAPSAGSAFAGWTGGGCNGLGTCTVAMNAAISVSAAFAASAGATGSGSFPLATAVAGPGKGTVTADADLGLACDRDVLCLVDVASASPPRVVTLRATPASDSRFAGWIDACSGTGDCVLPMDRSQLARAVFVPRLAQLSVSLSGQGTIATTPAGALACAGSACVGQLETAGVPVQLRATPGAGWHFAGWAANECSGTGPCAVPTDHDRSIGARFERDSYPLTVLVIGAGGASRVVGGGIDCSAAGGICTVDVQNTVGAQVALEARPDADSVFVRWLGTCGATPACTYAMTSPTVAVAEFGPRKYNATIQLVGLGSGTVVGGGLTCASGASVSCTGEVPRGVVSFEATPDAGSFIAGWGGVCPRDAGFVCTVDFVGSGIVQVQIETMTVPLTVGVAGPGSVSGPAPFTCSGDGQQCTLEVDNTQAPRQAQVTLTATPASGAEFWGWSGPCQGSGSTCTVRMDGAQSVVAHFRSP